VTSRRSLRATSKPTATIRRAQYAGTERLVIPVVALIGDSVVRPMGSVGPELVPASLLASIPPEIWNGRPVIPDHPGLNSANDPETLAAMSFGQVFNAQFRNNALQMEMWIDPVRAAQIGGDAQDVVERCLAGQVVEVSVGAFVAVVPRAGVTDAGVPYEYVWVDLYSDHLAALPRDVVGACSVEMGCGAPRAAARAAGGSSPNLNLSNPFGGETLKNIMQRLMAVFRPAAGESDDGASDSELRQSLSIALFAAEPGFDWIVDVWQDTQTVVYMCFIMDDNGMGQGNGHSALFQRTYGITDAGAVTLNDDRVEVKAKTVYVPLSADAAPQAAQVTPSVATSATSTSTLASSPASTVLSSCGCQNGAHGTTNTASPSGGTSNMGLTAEQRLARITTLSGKLKLSAAGVKVLEGMTDEDLETAGKELEAAEAPASTPGTTAPATPSSTPASAPTGAPTPESTPTAPSTPPTTPQTANLSAGDTSTAALPPQDLALVRGLLDELRARDTAERGALITALSTSSASSVFTSEQLQSKPTSELRQLAAIAFNPAGRPVGSTLPPVDFSGMGMPRAASADDIVPPPTSMAEALKTN